MFRGFLALLLAAPALALPVLEVTHDDTVITRSCRIVIRTGTVLADANTNGVLHVAADDLTIEFAPGSELRGAPPGTPWDTLRGIGIRIEGRRRVTLRGARVHGYFNGLVATRADGLRLEGATFRTTTGSGCARPRRPRTVRTGCFPTTTTRSNGATSTAARSAWRNPGGSPSAARGCAAARTASSLIA